MAGATQQNDLSILILAAGMGTRMCSSLPKVMHSLAGRPMLGHVLEAAQALSPTDMTVVVGPDMGVVSDYASSVIPSVRTVVQEERLGTGHAVKVALDAGISLSGKLLVLYGDTPFITAELLSQMIETLSHPSEPSCVVMGFTPEDPLQYGRLITKGENEVERIVEYKDATDEEREVTLCNSGVMGFKGIALPSLITVLSNENAKGEYYLTDCVAHAADQGGATHYIIADEASVRGINSRIELADAERIIQQRLRHKAMEEGVTLVQPDTVTFAYDTILGQDVVIHPHVVFGPGAKVASHVKIKSFSHIEGATISNKSIIGPYARLRPGAVLEEEVHIGNFVEVKNSVLHSQVKANHLTYIGDAEIGEGTNIGAGTITCNYDGFHKHKTSIGKHVFVGSQSCFVAPVEVGNDAIIAAGSVITETVEAEALAVTRTKQNNVLEKGVEIRRKKAGEQS